MKHIKNCFLSTATYACLTLTWQSPAFANFNKEPAILIIGASFANGATPFNDALQAPLDGVCVNFGSYLSVGNAIVRDTRLSGNVINEAQAGATTFDRLACGSVDCGAAGWHGYATQLTKAMARVAIPDPAHAGQILGYNADHVILSIPNDCLHSSAFELPQSLAVPCDEHARNAVVTRLIAVGQTALAHGITPVFEAYPEWASLNFPLMRSLYGMTWTIDEASYNHLRSQHMARVVSELPASLLVNPWQNFVHLGDGLHPSHATAMHAGRKFAHAIVAHRGH